MEPAAFISILANPVRLAVAGLAAAGHPFDPEELAPKLGVTPRKVLEAKAALQGAGVIKGDGTLDSALLQSVAAALPSTPPPSSSITAAGTWTEEELQILGRFFSEDRLVEIPGSRAKRRVVLERLAQEFDPGVRYREAEVSFVLQLFHPDYAALRRYLVDEGFLTRAEGVYWRTGGRFSD